MIKQEGILKEKLATGHLAENQEGGRRGVRGAGPLPEAWLCRVEPDGGGGGRGGWGRWGGRGGGMPGTH